MSVPVLFLYHFGMRVKSDRPTTHRGCGRIDTLRSRAGSEFEKALKPRSVGHLYGHFLGATLLAVD